MSRSRTLVLLASLCFGTTGTAQALGPDGAQPLAVGAVRIAIGAALLVAVLRMRGGGLPHRSDLGALAFAAGGVAAYQLCFFAAVRETGVAVGTVVALGSAPALAGALGWLVDRDAPTPNWLVATALAIAGVAVLALAGGGADVRPAGVALALGAGASYALFTLGSKRLLDAGHGTEAVMAWAFGAGAILLVPVLVIGDLAWLGEPSGIAMALWLGAIATALAYLLFAAGLQRLPPRDVTTLTLAEPVTATILSLVVLGERPAGLAIAGIVLVLAGLVVLARGTPASVPAREPAVGPPI
jgi:DME family drug/metabolite transporter